METITYQEKVGDKVYPLKVKGARREAQKLPDSFKEDDKLLIGNIEADHVQIDSKDLRTKQVELAIELILSSKEYDPDLLNYVFNISGLKGKEFAKLLEVAAPTLTAYRRKNSSMSASTWKLFRIVFIQHLRGIVSKDNSLDKRVIDQVVFPKAC